eukprot:jgi/Tetstr1/438969/TSEL_027462.t1
MAFQSLSSSAATAAAIRRFTPDGQPAWRACSNQFGTMLPDGPTLALTKTHVALQEKTTELEFVQGAFQRAQAAWAQEKADLLDEVRALRSERALLDRQVKELKTSETEQKQAASLAADGWAREREVMRALHHKEAGELARNLKAVTAEAQFLENRARVLKTELQEKRDSVPREEYSQVAQAAQAKIHEIEARTADEIRAVWQDRTNLLNHNMELETLVGRLQEELDTERKIRAAHLSHAQILADDKVRLGGTLERVAERNSNLQAALERSAMATGGQSRPRSRSASPAKRPASAAAKASSKSKGKQATLWR